MNIHHWLINGVFKVVSVAVVAHLAPQPSFSLTPGTKNSIAAPYTAGRTNTVHGTNGTNTIALPLFGHRALNTQIAEKCCPYLHGASGGCPVGPCLKPPLGGMDTLVFVSCF